ncbi:MAG: hypothetical protein ACQESP_00965 [Candidatus Muiribacteriota bacterium]
MNSEETHVYLKNYSDGIHLFKYPYLPSIQKVFLVYSDDMWKTISELEMFPDDKNKNFQVELNSHKDIGYRFKFFKKNEKNKVYFEDNNQKNYYFPFKQIYWQVPPNKISATSDIIFKGKNLLFFQKYNKQHFAYIVFEFDNIFHYKSILDNFNTFYITDNCASNTKLVKKLNDKVTWYIPPSHPVITSDLKKICQNFFNLKNTQAGIVNLTKTCNNIEKAFYTYLNLNLDYLILDNTILWTTGED